MGKKAPRAPDPKQTSAAQTGTNVASTIANAWMTNMNEVTPDGTKTFNQTGQTSFTDPFTGQTYQIPRFTVTQTLSPQQQRVKSQQDRASLNLAKIGADQSGKIGALLGSSIDLAGIPQAPGSAPDGPDLTTSFGGDWSEDRRRVESALLSRIRPQQDQDRQALRAQLINQGMNEGSSSFERAMGRLDEKENDARMQAILAGGQEQSRLAGLAERQARFGNDALQQMFANALTGFNAQNQLRGNALQEKFALRNQPLNEIGALLSGGQVSMPQFMTGAQVQPMRSTDNAAIINNNYNQKMATWQHKQAAMGSTLSGLGGLFMGL